MLCPHCNSNVPENFKFCGNCGKPLENICPKCNTSLPAGFKFCGRCGTPLTKSEPQEYHLEFPANTSSISTSAIIETLQQTLSAENLRVEEIGKSHVVTILKKNNISIDEIKNLLLKHPITSHKPLDSLTPEENLKSKIYGVLTTIVAEESSTPLKIEGSKFMHYIGFSLEKGEIEVEGDCGDYLGAFMKGGSIYVNGDVGDYTGFKMSDGVISIEGDCGDYTGACMRGGEIKVQGDVKDNAGSRMIGGTLIIEGDAEDGIGCFMKNGKIVLKGDAEDKAGFAMEGGSLIIYGDVEDFAGAQMQGGYLKIEGEYGDNFCTGKRE